MLLEVRAGPRSYKEKSEEQEEGDHVGREGEAGDASRDL